MKKSQEQDELTLPSASQIDTILEFLPRLEAQKGQFVEPQEELNLLWVSYVPVMDELVQSLYANDFIPQGFNWPEWTEGREHGEDPAWIAAADLETLCKLFTAHVRNDRFCAGHLGAMCEQGHIQEVLKKLQELRAEM